MWNWSPKLCLIKIAKQDRLFRKDMDDVSDEAERMSTGKSFQIIEASKLKLALICLVDLWKKDEFRNVKNNAFGS